jgi:hypothetical protein
MKSNGLRSAGSSWRNESRINRLIRFRCGAVPTRRETLNPNRGFGNEFGNANNLIGPRVRLTPDSYTAANAKLPLNRIARVNRCEVIMEKVNRR